MSGQDVHARRPVTLSDIRDAAHRIAGHVTRTPLRLSPYLSEQFGHPVRLKLETMQDTGAVKLRGATNALLSLGPAERDRGVIAVSTGNHGRGVAYAAKTQGITCCIYMSELVPAVKVDAIRALGAEVVIVGRSQDDAEAEAMMRIDRDGLTYIHPFDNPHVIAGQGTIGLEILEDMPDVANVIVPLSGGGLFCGIATAVKTMKPSARLSGITMENGAAMIDSLDAGKPVPVEEIESLADSLGGGIGLDNKLSFRLCRDHLDDVILVTEEEIYRALQTHYFEDRLVCEGASAVGAAALIAGRLGDLAGPVATIITGRNVDMAVFSAIMRGADVTLGDYRITGAPYAA